MLKLRIKELAKSRGITHVYSHLVQRGLSKRVAWKLADDKVLHLSLKNIELLCDIYKCEPNDLFVYDSEDKTGVKAKPWFANILPDKNRLNITDLLPGATEEQLRKMEAYMKEVMGRK